MGNARVFTIPPGLPFLPTFADALCSGRIVGAVRDLGSLGAATIYCPNRRAARALAAHLAERGGARALLLPRIVALGEADEAGLGEAADEGGFPQESLAPPIPPIERRLVLTRLVQSWSLTVDRNLLGLKEGMPFLVPSSPADAVGLAGDLEALMDSFATEDVAWDALAAAVEAEHSRYFAITLDFVRIASQAWPAILAERNASDPARRRGELLRREAARLLDERPEAPVIVAGSTGSVPATAALIAAISRLPNGAVVLPGLDRDCDEASWERIGHGVGGADPAHGHPQAVIKRLVTHHLRIARADVRSLGEPDAGGAARARLLSEVLRPADTTEAWADLGSAERLSLAREGAAGIAVIEAVDERDEALAVALALRETLEHPGRTAALVTPDRALAARVAAELARWGIAIEDSAGIPLGETPCGRLARLAAEAVALDFPPARLVALLAHPDLRLGLDRERLERGAAALEIAILRGPAPAPGLDGLAEALAVRRAEKGHHEPRPFKRLDPEDFELAAALLDALAEAFEPLLDLRCEGPQDLLALAAAHRETLRRLRLGQEGEPPDEPDAAALDSLFEDLALTNAGPIAGRFTEYKDVFAALAATRVLPPPHRASHRRLKILGLLEARLLTVDRVVLGGLDEGIWPPRTEADAFLNRPMRAAIGLSAPERRIGQTAHDFVQALGTRDAVVTRARKRDGSPTVPSRFLQRLKAFAGEEVWRGLVAAGHRWRVYARLLETPEPEPPLRRPEPRPDPALIPRRLSVTQAETLIRDPYALYARAVLGLDPLGPLGGATDASERGTIVHDLLAGFVRRFPDAMPETGLARGYLLAEGGAAFAAIERLSPRLHAEWWPRFVALAGAFIAWEALRRDGLKSIAVEASGRLDLVLADGSAFVLTARADRIETAADGAVTLIDFKTGAPPTAKTVYAGFSPQLTLQAAMLTRGAFRDVGRVDATPAMAYVRASGGRDPLETVDLKPPKQDARTLGVLIEEHLKGLTDLLSGYVSGERAFLSRPFPQHARRFSEYDHLARVGEWSLAGEAEEGG